MGEGGDYRKIVMCALTLSIRGATLSELGGDLISYLYVKCNTVAYQLASLHPVSAGMTDLCVDKCSFALISRTVHG